MILFMQSVHRGITAMGSDTASNPVLTMVAACATMHKLPSRLSQPAPHIQDRKNRIGTPIKY